MIALVYFPRNIYLLSGLEHILVLTIRILKVEGRNVHFVYGVLHLMILIKYYQL